MRLERMGLERTRVGLSAARKIVELPASRRPGRADKGSHPVTPICEQGT